MRTDRPIFLYSGQATGTMYLRRLLEAHRAVDFCRLENLRVDVDRQPGYTIAPPLHTRGVAIAGETTFAALITSWLRGERTTADLLAYYAHWRDEMLVAKQGPPWRLVATTGRHMLRKIFAIEPRPKDATARLFFHEHLRFSHLAADYACLADFDVVVPLRHPLLTVVSLLRRRGDELGIWELWAALDRVANIPNVIYHPIDLAADADDLRRRLDLPIDDRFEQAAAVDVVVNKTAQGRPLNGQHPSKDKNPALLDARRRLLAGEGVAPIIGPYWRHARRSRFLAIYEAAGYDFAGL